MKKIIAGIAMVAATMVMSVSSAYAENIAGFEFEEGNLLGAKVELLAPELKEGLELEDGKTYHLVTIGIRSDDSGVKTIKATIPLDKDSIVVPEAYDKTIIGGGYFTNVIEKNYNPENGFLTFEATTDAPSTTSSEVDEAFGFVTMVKADNQKKDVIIKVQGVDGEKVPDVTLEGATTGENLFKGLLNINMKNLPVTKEPVKKEPVKKEPTKKAPEKVKEPTEEPKTVEPEKIETGASQALTLIALLIISLTSITYVKRAK